MDRNAPPLNRRQINPAEERFWAKVERRGADDCWTWTAGTSEGYGQFGLSRRSGSIRAHRFAYELLIGPVPDGLELDHLCRNRLCVNPAHLEPVSRRENILRGESPTAQHARQTHCKNGHPLSGDNLYLHPKGSRVCLTCKRAYERRHHPAYRRQKREESR